MNKAEAAMLIVTMTLIVMDYVTGLIKAVMHKDLSSTKMREGLYHKSAFVMVVVLAEVIDHAQTYIDLGFTVPVLASACVYICLTEITSIVENLGEINPEIQGSRILQLFRVKEEQ